MSSNKLDRWGMRTWTIKWSKRLRNSPRYYIVVSISIVKQAAMMCLWLWLSSHDVLLFSLMCKKKKKAINAPKNYSLAKSRSIKRNYCVLSEYHKYVFLSLTCIIGSTMNLINDTYHLCERKKHIFIILWKYLRIFHESNL